MPRWPRSTSNAPSSTVSGTTPSHQIPIAQIARLSRDGPLDLLDQLHLRAVGRGNPAHMPTVVDALFDDLRAVLLNVGERAGVIVGLDRDVLDADMLLMVLVGDDRRHVELHAVQVWRPRPGISRFTVAPKLSM